MPSAWPGGPPLTRAGLRTTVRASSSASAAADPAVTAADPVVDLWAELPARF